MQGHQMNFTRGINGTRVFDQALQPDIRLQQATLQPQYFTTSFIPFGPFNPFGTTWSPFVVFQAPPMQTDTPARIASSGLGNDVDRLVALSPKLHGDLGDLRKKGWTIVHGPAGRGSYTDRSAMPPRIVIDAMNRGRPLQTTQALAHETGHALYQYTEDVSSKKAYVDGKLADEGAATLNNIKVRREILAHGGPDIGIAGNAANHPAYNAAYDQFVKDGDAAKARHTIGQIYGRGEFTSVNNQSYRDYYGTWYDWTYPTRW